MCTYVLLNCPFQSTCSHVWEEKWDSALVEQRCFRSCSMMWWIHAAGVGCAFEQMWGLPGRGGNPLLLPLTGGSGNIIVCSLHHTCTTWMLLTHDAGQAHLNISDGFYFEVYQVLSKNRALSVWFDCCFSKNLARNSWVLRSSDRQQHDSSRTPRTFHRYFTGEIPRYFTSLSPFLALYFKKHLILCVYF